MKTMEKSSTTTRSTSEATRKVVAPPLLTLCGRGLPLADLLLGRQPLTVSSAAGAKTCTAPKTESSGMAPIPTAQNVDTMYMSPRGTTTRRSKT